MLKMKCLTSISCQEAVIIIRRIRERKSLPDSRRHRIIRRCHSAESEIKTSSPFKDEPEKKEAS